jgi:hypothetical protein
MVNPHAGASIRTLLKISAVSAREAASVEHTCVDMTSIFATWVAIIAEPWYGPKKIAFTESLDATAS